MAEEYEKGLDIRQRASLANSGGLIDFVIANKYKTVLWLVVTVAMITLWVTATETMAGIFLTIAQFLLGAAFMIVQFAALFLFLGRGRIYWVQPGETGVTFTDYRGNDQILEVARRVVTILRGQSDVRQMGGTYTAGLLLEGPPGSGKSYLAQAMATEQSRTNTTRTCALPRSSRAPMLHPGHPTPETPSGSRSRPRFRRHRARGTG